MPAPSYRDTSPERPKGPRGGGSKYLIASAPLAGERRRNLPSAETHPGRSWTLPQCLVGPVSSGGWGEGREQSGQSVLRSIEIGDDDIDVPSSQPTPVSDPRRTSSQGPVSTLLVQGREQAGLAKHSSNEMLNETDRSYLAPHLTSHLIASPPMSLQSSFRDDYRAAEVAGGSTVEDGWAASLETRPSRTRTFYTSPTVSARRNSDSDEAESVEVPTRQPERLGFDQNTSGLSQSQLYEMARSAGLTMVNSGEGSIMHTTLTSTDNPTPGGGSRQGRPPSSPNSLQPSQSHSAHPGRRYRKTRSRSHSRSHTPPEPEPNEVSWAPPGHSSLSGISQRKCALSLQQSRRSPPFFGRATFHSPSSGWEGEFDGGCSPPIRPNWEGQDGGQTRFSDIPIIPQQRHTFAHTDGPEEMETSNPSGEDTNETNFVIRHALEVAGVEANYFGQETSGTTDVSCFTKSPPPGQIITGTQTSHPAPPSYPPPSANIDSDDGFRDFYPQTCSDLAPLPLPIPIAASAQQMDPNHTYEGSNNRSHSVETPVGSRQGFSSLVELDVHPSFISSALNLSLPPEDERSPTFEPALNTSQMSCRPPSAAPLPSPGRCQHLPTSHSGPSPQPPAPTSIDPRAFGANYVSEPVSPPGISLERRSQIEHDRLIERQNELARQSQQLREAARAVREKERLLEGHMGRLSQTPTPPLEGTHYGQRTPNHFPCEAGTQVDANNQSLSLAYSPSRDPDEFRSGSPPRHDIDHLNEVTRRNRERDLKRLTGHAPHPEFPLIGRRGRASSLPLVTNEPRIQAPSVTFHPPPLAQLPTAPNPQQAQSDQIAELERKLAEAQMLLDREREQSASPTQPQLVTDTDPPTHQGAPHTPSGLVEPNSPPMLSAEDVVHPQTPTSIPTTPTNHPQNWHTTPPPVLSPGPPRVASPPPALALRNHDLREFQERPPPERALAEEGEGILEGPAAAAPIPMECPQVQKVGEKDSDQAPSPPQPPEVPQPEVPQVDPIQLKTLANSEGGRNHPRAAELLGNQPPVQQRSGKGGGRSGECCTIC